MGHKGIVERDCLNWFVACSGQYTSARDEARESRTQDVVIRHVLGHHFADVGRRVESVVGFVDPAGTCVNVACEHAFEIGREGGMERTQSTEEINVLH